MRCPCCGSTNLLSQCLCTWDDMLRAIEIKRRKLAAEKQKRATEESINRLRKADKAGRE